MSALTPRQQEIYDEIKLYNDRMGRWPYASVIKKICKLSDSTFWITFKRMKEKGFVEYAGDFENGKSRQVKVL